MALRIASEIFGNTTRGGAAVVAWDSNDMFATRSGDEAPTFYVVTPEYGAGFVIVAGDDAVRPILGYSTTYPIAKAEFLPENFAGWLRYIDAAVRYARQCVAEADDAVARLWSASYKPVGAIMLNTARWSQLAPYYNQCPMDGDCHSLTGCTQTAMAIIMYHHRWPERAKGLCKKRKHSGGALLFLRRQKHPIAQKIQISNR